MASNGIVRFLTSAKAIVFILITLVALAAWFLAMGGNVDQNVKQLEINTPNIQQNREAIIGMQKDISYIKDGIDDIKKKL